MDPDGNRPKSEEARLRGQGCSACRRAHGCPHSQRLRGRPDPPKTRLREAIRREASHRLLSLLTDDTWLPPPPLHPASDFVSGLGIPGTSVIVFCPTAHVQAQGLDRVPACRRPRQ